MELRVMRYFLTLCREESISKAAESLYITQPTLSRQLAELEEELGTQLFIRGKRKITLTEDGMLFRRRAEEMLDFEDKVEREFRLRSENLSGVISIGAAETKAAEILPQAITSFRKKYPEVTFDIYSDIASHVKERIDGGTLDIGLLVEPGDIEKYDFFRLGIDDRCGILMNAASPLAEKETVTVKDLIGLPVLTNKRPSMRSFYRKALGEDYDKLNVAATFNLINNAALFALNNSGYIFTIEGTIANYENENLVFRPFYPEIKLSSFIVWKKYQPLSKAVKKFLEEISMLVEHNSL